jgi:DNA-binding protein H-NS
LNINYITIGDIEAGDAQTAELLDAIAALKTEVRDRANEELDNMAARARELHALLDEQPAPAKAPGKGRKPLNPPKYAHPDDPSKTWTGKGKKPDWFRTYSGNPDDLLIAPTLFGGDPLAD